MPILVPPSAVADNLLELADAFGVYATLFASEKQISRWEWETGSFRERYSEMCRSLCITVRTPDERFGQAWSNDWSSSAVERAFHMARRCARVDPAAVEACRRLAESETRLLGLRLPASDWQAASGERAAYMAEQLHHEIASGPSTPAVQTIFTFQEEQLYAARSDGTTHTARLFRALTEHTLFDASGYRQLRSGIAGTSLPETIVFRPPDEWIPCEPRPSGQPLVPSGCWNEHSLSNRLLMLDIRLFARIVYAWVHSEQPGSHGSAATIQAEALDGSPGHLPIHPWGYLFASMPLLSPAGCDSANLAAVRVRSFDTHLSVQLPHLPGSPTSAALRLATGKQHGWFSEKNDEEVWLLEGTQWFAFDRQTGTCCFVPGRFRRYANGKATLLDASPISIPLSLVMRSIRGGVGESATAWGADDSLWTVSAPRYVLVQWERERCS
jgi:hypothetical protein